MKLYRLRRSISIRSGRQWVEIPEGARVELIRRAELKAGDPMRATLDRAVAGFGPPGWRVIRLLEEWAPLPRGHRVVVLAENLKPETGQ